MNEKLKIKNEKWEKMELSHIFEISKNKFNPKIANENKKCIELEHISQGTGKLLGYTNSSKQQSIKNVFKKNQVLFGKLRPYLKKYWKANFEGVCSTEIWVLSGKSVTNDYLFQLIQTNKFNQIANVSSGSKMPRADWKYMSEIPFDIPPIEEQQKIADILTSWDRAIEKMQTLITVKEKLKKGLMQKLLSGEVRFAGFDEEWEDIRLRDVGRIITGTTPPTKEKEYYDNGNYPWITPTDIDSKREICKSERYLTKKGLKKGRFVPKGSLLVACIASIGKNAILSVDGSCNQQINAILPSNKNNIVFLYYIMEYYSEYLLKYAGKSATPILNKKSFGNLKFKFPVLQEQQKIAQVLTTADKEIELLKKELEALKEQKRGLIQKLLTGEVRVRV